MYDHPGTGLLGTRCEHLALLVLNHTHPAGTVDRQIRVIAECGDIYTGFPDKGQYVFLTLYRHLDAVYCHVIHL